MPAPGSAQLRGPRINSGGHPSRNRIPAYAGMTQVKQLSLIKKLFRQDPFIQTVIGIEQHGHFPAPVLGDIDAGDIADLEIVRSCADRAFLRLQNVEADLHLMREQGAPPATGPERTERQPRTISRSA